MNTTTSYFLEVPGARLHYEITGKGPWLLLLQGGDGDADGTKGIAGSLKEHFTIISYDRRGLSQSSLTSPSEELTLQVHTDDIHHLLLHLTTEPVYIFGTSIGALLGIDFLVRYPQQVRLLVAHEPPLTQFLDKTAAIKAAEQQEEIENAFQRGSIAEAMQKFVALAGISFKDKEPDAEFPKPTPQRTANLAFFLQNDAPAVRKYRLNPGELQQVADKVFLAAGTTSGENLAHQCTISIAEFLRKEITIFPGGHNGFITHPKAFAMLLATFLLSKPQGIDTNANG